MISRSLWRCCFILLLHSLSHSTSSHLPPSILVLASGFSAIHQNHLQAVLQFWQQSTVFALPRNHPLPAVWRRFLTSQFFTHSLPRQFVSSLFCPDHFFSFCPHHLILLRLFPLFLQFVACLPFSFVFFICNCLPLLLSSPFFSEKKTFFYLRFCKYFHRITCNWEAASLSLLIFRNPSPNRFSVYRLLLCLFFR